MLDFATCAAGEEPVVSGQSASRLYRYWDKLDRQLSAYLRAHPRKPSPLPAPDNSDVAVRDNAAGEHKPANTRTRYRAPESLDRCADNRFNPAAMSDAERAALLDAEIWRDCAAVEQRMRRFHKCGWRIIDVLDANCDPIIVDAWVAVSRLPVSGSSPRWQMPEPILSPEYVACPELADAWREAAGIETTRDAALRFVAQQSARMAEAIQDARQERVTTGAAIDPYDLFAMADRCDSILQAAGIAARAFHLLANCGS